MINSKRIIAILMCMLLVFSLAGCSKKDIKKNVQQAADMLEDAGVTTEAALAVTLDTIDTTIDVSSKTAVVMGGMAENLITSMPEGVDNPFNGPVVKSSDSSITATPDEILVASSYEEVNKKIAAGESFYVYFGESTDKLCKTIIKIAADRAAKAGVNKVLYVDTWNAGDTRLSSDETVAAQYEAMMKSFASVLPEDYVMGDKPYLRIPAFVHIVNGKAVGFTSAVPEGISMADVGPNGELPDQIRPKVKSMLDEFFK